MSKNLQVLTKGTLLGYDTDTSYFTGVGLNNLCINQKISNRV